ncbi:hypothetical protein NQZ68_001380 [Dissostichus eleginoides]|nr:hypothetical protein NQZ68_001380 [Dissostichus eleginoides]
MPSAADVLWQARPRAHCPMGSPYRTDHLAAPVMGTGRPAFTVKKHRPERITTNICISACPSPAEDGVARGGRNSVGTSGPYTLSTPRGKGPVARCQIHTGAQLALDMGVKHTPPPPVSGWMCRGGLRIVGVITRGQVLDWCPPAVLFYPIRNSICCPTQLPAVATPPPTQVGARCDGGLPCPLCPPEGGGGGTVGSLGPLTCQASREGSSRLPAEIATSCSGFAPPPVKMRDAGLFKSWANSQTHQQLVPQGL